MIVFSLLPGRIAGLTELHGSINSMNFHKSNEVAPFL